MASLVYTLASMVQVASLHCSMRPEISPCSCAPHEIFNNTIYVTCDGLTSFNQLFDSLQNKFSSRDNIWLKITKSQLDDLETRKFKDMNMNITKLSLDFDDLRTLPESSFRNLSQLRSFSLADNHLEEIPRHIFQHMSKIVTMDLANGRIKTVLADDLRSLSEIRYLTLVNNNIHMVEKDSIPKTLRFLHLGRNNLTSLNGTIRDNMNIDVLFLNENYLTTLDGELPIKSPHFQSLIIHHNKLQNLTQDLGKFKFLDAVYISDNEIKSLDGVFRNSSFIEQLQMHNNKIEYLAEDEFLHCGELQELDLAGNQIKAINNSLLPLKKVRICNFSRNDLAEFSLDEVRGLRDLQVVDLSFNRIEKLTGHLENVVDQDLYFNDLRLHHNLLKSLDGAMMNLNRLKSLDLSFNNFNRIAPNDLIGLDDLVSLNISHNFIQSLEGNSMTFLPKLEKLYSSYNNLSKLEHDFHGLPTLCFADLSNNHITHISPELVVKTRCNSHGVTNKLEILLQENPILCMDELSKLFAVMEAQETRLLGIAHCIVPKEEEIPIIEPVFVPPPAEDPAEAPEVEEKRPKPEKEEVKEAELEQAKEDVIEKDEIANEKENAPVKAEVMPPEVDVMLAEVEEPVADSAMNAVFPQEVAVILSTIAHSAAKAEEPVMEVVFTTTETHVPNPDDNNVDIVTHTEKPMVSSTTEAAVALSVDLGADNDTAPSSLNYIKHVENITVLDEPPASADLTNQSSITQATESSDVPTPSTSPSIAEIVLGEMESVSKSPESDNYIYETFSPISPVDIGAVATFQRNDHLVLAEEPPEIPAVPAA